MAGYIGNAPVPQATQTRDNFTATAGQTSFATSGYTPGYLDVYLNGVRLDESDYTATNGSDVVLDTGAAVDDVVSVVAFQTFEVNAGISLGDNVKAKFGDGDDLQIYSDGSNSIIKESGAGNLIINGDQVNIANAADTEYKARFNTNGSVQLYYDNAEKLATTSSGVDVTGKVAADGVTLDQTTSLIGTDTSDGSDNKSVMVNGGGVASDSRGAYVWVKGNEHADPGKLQLHAGNVGSAPITMSTGGTERMRIDSSGNLLVGKTATGLGSTGFQAVKAGQSAFVSDGDRSLILNRQTSDGDILEFRKDGTTVGSIGSVAGSYPYIGSRKAGYDTFLNFISNSSQSIRPSTSAGASLDNAITLGSSSARWKDLYLSGGVYLGGTGSANHLDDYEEGTWTPNVATGTLGVADGSYIKIGHTVFVTGILGNFSDRTSSSSIIVNNMPFVSKSNDDYQAHGVTMYRYINLTKESITAYLNDGNDDVLFYASRNGADWTPIQHDHLNNAGAYLRFSIVYQAT